MPALPIVIDTDPGIDDLVAVTLALRAPELRVVAITTSYGNAPLAHTTRNLRVLLEMLEHDAVPVLAGADGPLTRAPPLPVNAHGPTGAGHAPVPAVEPVHADPLALCRALALADEAVTLVTLGPLTNLALALEADRTLVQRRVQRHVGMFGSLAVSASPDRWADFNAWSDPDALTRVLDAGLATTMVGLDVTHRVTLLPELVAALAAADDRVQRWLGQALQFYVESHHRRGLLDGCRVHDVLPVAYLISPGLLTLAERRVTVDLGEGEDRGRTVETGHGTAVTVAIGADLTGTRRLLQRVFPILT